MELGGHRYQRWERHQATLAESRLAAMPERSRFRERLAFWTDALPSILDMKLRGGSLYVLARTPGEEVARLFVRTERSTRLLFDPRRTQAGRDNLNIEYFEPSPDGERIVVGVARNGSEDADLLVVDARTGEIETVMPGKAHAAPSWTPDGRAFAYRQFSSPDPDQPGELYRRGIIYYHQLDADDASDMPVFGFGVTDHVSLDPDDTCHLVFPPQAPDHAFATCYRGVNPPRMIFMLSVDRLRKGQLEWKQIVAYDESIEDFAIGSHGAYLLSTRDAPNGSIAHLPLAMGPVKPETVLSASSSPVRRILFARDGLYVSRVDRGAIRLYRLSETRSLEQVPLPRSASAESVAADPLRPGVAITLSSWDQPQALASFHPAERRLVIENLFPASRVKLPSLKVEHFQAVSRDGTAIPVTLVRRADTKASRPVPLILYGYGAYGTSLMPELRPDRMAWLERGGAYAFAHVRGGGENGAAWRDAARRANKNRSVEDFIACAEELIRRGFAVPESLGAYGASAGGITVGGATVRRPELFGAVVLVNAVVNPARSEKMGVGPGNVYEFGSMSVPAERKTLLRVDAYHQVREGMHYPAFLLMVAANDRRVPTWQSGKLVARLQRASRSGRPVLLHVNGAGGHLLNTRQERIDAGADIHAFFWSQLTWSAKREATSARQRATNGIP